MRTFGDKPIVSLWRPFYACDLVGRRCIRYKRVCNTPELYTFFTARKHLASLPFRCFPFSALDAARRVHLAAVACRRVYFIYIHSIPHTCMHRERYPGAVSKAVHSWKTARALSHMRCMCLYVRCAGLASDVRLPAKSECWPARPLFLPLCILARPLDACAWKREPICAPRFRSSGRGPFLISAAAVVNARSLGTGCCRCIALLLSAPPCKSARWTPPPLSLSLLLIHLLTQPRC